LNKPKEKMEYRVSLANIKLNTVRPFDPEADAAYAKKRKKLTT